uniref:Uncharacterized protein n=1 Tax=Aliivibrio wodanis TaxID=80852 RepID=A0A5Q4ZW06_9GAMM|nr:hypothetical protein AW0309160_03847 [Aliivibrio wodanis]
MDKNDFEWNKLLHKNILPEADPELNELFSPLEEDEIYKDFFSEHQDEDFALFFAKKSRLDKFGYYKDWNKLESSDFVDMSPMVVPEVSHMTGETISHAHVFLKDCPIEYLDLWKTIAFEKIVEDKEWREGLPTDHFVLLERYRLGITTLIPDNHLSIFDLPSEEKAYLFSDKLPPIYQEMITAGIEHHTALRFAHYEKFLSTGSYEDTFDVELCDLTEYGIAKFPIRSRITSQIIEYKTLFHSEHHSDLDNIDLTLYNRIFDLMTSSPKPIYTPLHSGIKIAVNISRANFDPFHSTTTVIFPPLTDDKQYGWYELAVDLTNPMHFQVPIYNQDKSQLLDWGIIDDASYIPLEFRPLAAQVMLDYLHRNPDFIHSLKRHFFYDLDVKNHALTKIEACENNDALCDYHKGGNLRLSAEELDQIHNTEWPPIYHKLRKLGFNHDRCKEFALCSKLMKYGYFFDINGIKPLSNHKNFIGIVPIRSKVTYEQIGELSIKSSTDLNNWCTQDIETALKKNSNSFASTSCFDENNNHDIEAVNDFELDFDDPFHDDSSEKQAFKRLCSSEKNQNLNTFLDWVNLRCGCPEVSPIFVDEICSLTGDVITGHWCDVEDLPTMFIEPWRKIAIEKLATDKMWANYLDIDHFTKLIQHQKGELTAYQYSHSHLSLSDEEKHYLFSDTLPESYQEFINAGVNEETAYKFALYEKLSCYGFYEDTVNFVYPQPSLNRFVEIPIRSLVTHEIIDYKTIFFSQMKTLSDDFARYFIESIYKREEPYFCPLFIANREHENLSRHNYDPFYSVSTVNIKPFTPTASYYWHNIKFSNTKPNHFMVEVDTSYSTSIWQEFDDVAYVPLEERISFIDQLIAMMAAEPSFAISVNVDIFYQLDVKPHLITKEQVNTFNHELCKKHTNITFSNLEGKSNYLHSDEMPKIYQQLKDAGVADEFCIQFALCSKLMEFSYFFDLSGTYRNKDYPYHLATIPIRSRVTFEQLGLLPIKSVTELGSGNATVIEKALKNK